MEKSKKHSNDYVYGSVAYDIQPEIKNEKKPIKRRKTKNRVKIKLKMVGSIFIIALISLLTLSRFASTIKLTYDIRTVKSEIKKVQEANENTRVQMAKISNIKNIEETAVSKLGMIIPDKNKVVYIDVKPLTSLKDQSKEGTKTAANEFVQKIIGFIH
jgi:cell division protein FtsL